MFRSKLKSSVETLQWKVKSLEEQNKELRAELEKALKTLRKHVLAVKNGAPVSEEALLYGLPFDFITGKELEAFCQANPSTLLLDVRTSPEVQSGFIPNAKHIPVDQLPFRVEELGKDRELPVITYCASGARAQVACETLIERGFRRVLTLKGGVGSYPGTLAVPEKPPVSSVEIPKDLTTDNPDLAKKVQNLLDEEINPGVAAHGGRVSLVAVQGDKVYLRFGGGCHGCGQVDVTLKQGITTRMREVLGAIEDVIDVTDHATGETPYFSAAAH